MLERDYKFYLSFENSICRDYATEKFFNPLRFSTVPVAYSGADYQALGVPKNSYIDARDFPSGKKTITSYQLFSISFDFTNMQLSIWQITFIIWIRTTRRIEAILIGLCSRLVLNPSCQVATISNPGVISVKSL